MTFNPTTLTPIVLAAYKQGSKFWPLAVKRVLDAAIFGLPKLTDMVF